MPGGLFKTVTCGDGNEAGVGTVVVRQDTGEACVIEELAWTSRAESAVIVTEGGRRDRVASVNLSVAASQSWPPEGARS